MKKNDYQTPEMELVKLNKKLTLLAGSGCDTQCDTEAGGGGGGF